MGFSLLSDENKKTPTEVFKASVRWKKEGDNFLIRIITTNETWINFYEPETKQNPRH